DSGWARPLRRDVMKNNTLAIALASLLVGGVAVGAYHNSRDTGAGSNAGLTGETLEAREDDRAGRLEYAQVVAVEPVTEKAELYATVIGAEPVRETTTSSSPRQVCEDVVVQERLPERDGNK